MATILDTLVINMNLDVSNYIQNIQMVRNETINFANEQSNQLDNVAKKTKSFLDAYSNYVQNFAGLFGKIAGLSSKFVTFMADISQGHAALGHLSERTGIATQELQKWGNMADIVGGKASEMQSGMADLQGQLDTVKKGGEAGKTVSWLKEMGVAVTDANGSLRQQSDIMLDLASKAERMSKPELYAQAKDAGMNESQIELIMKGRSELEKMLAAQAENALVSQQQAEQAAALNSKWQLMQQKIGSLATRILEDLSPTIEIVLGGLERFVNFLQQNRAYVYGFFAGLVVAMAPAIASVVALGASLLAAAAPFIVAGVIIGAIVGFLIDQFIKWKEGSDNIFSTIHGWIEKVIEKFKEFMNFLKSLLILFIRFHPFTLTLKVIWNIFKKFKELWDKWISSGKLLDWITGALNKVKTFFNDFVIKLGTIGKLISAIMKGEWGAVKDIVFKVVAKGTGKIADFFTGGENNPEAFIGSASAYSGRGASKGDRVILPKKELVTSALELSTKGNQFGNGFSSPFNQPSLALVSNPLSSNSPSLFSGLNRLRQFFAMDGGLGSNADSTFNLLSPALISNKSQATLGNSTSRSTNHSIENHIGEVKVYTAATDAQGIAGSLKDAIGHSFNTYAFDSGLT